ncbi:MAG: hypothetical protein V7784_05225 [Oceanospirillaceae bacterium]
MQTWLDANVLNALTRIRSYSVGPSLVWDFEARFLRPADANSEILRNLAEQGIAIFGASPLKLYRLLLSLFTQG